MRQALDDLLERLLEGTGLQVEDLVWGGLVFGLVFSLLHLGTMLVTSWGDSRASTKAFVFSLLVHLTSLLGIVTTSPETIGFSPPPEPKDPPPVEIRDLVFDNESEPEHRESGNSPRFDRQLDPVQPRAERSEPRPHEPRSLEEPGRTNERRQRDPLEIADASMRPDELTDDPLPRNMPNREARFRRPDSPELDVPSAERQDERTVNSGPTRTDIERRGGFEPEPELERRPPKTGSVIRESPQFQPLDRRIAALEFDGPDSLPKRGPVGPSIALRSGPVPSPIENEIGTNTRDSEKAGPAGQPEPQRLANNLPRANGGIDLEGGALDSVRPGQRIGLERSDRRPPREFARIGSLPGEFGLPDRVPAPRVEPGRPQEIVPALPNRPRLDPAKRAEIARRFGGSDESEKAVELALEWLAGVQNPGGFWDASEFDAGRVRYVLYDTKSGEEKSVSLAEARKQYEANQRLPENQRRIRVVDRENAGRLADPGVTGLALLAFFGAGHTPFDGPYASTVAAAIDWLSAQQADDGSLSGESGKYSAAYSHAIATFALAEALNVHRDYRTDAAESAQLERVVERAVRFSMTRQSPADGGWRYGPYVRGQLSDTSIFGWQLMAMKSAERAGVDIPKRTQQLMANYLTQASLGEDGGLAAYRRGLPASPSMTAEAQFCRQQFGRSREHPQSLEAIAYLRENLPDREKYDLYYWYYGTLAMRHHGGDAWNEWNDVVRDLLVEEQVTAGAAAGSWEPRSKWSGYGGRVYATAMSALCLESYYRFFRRDADRDAGAIVPSRP